MGVVYDSGLLKVLALIVPKQEHAEDTSKAFKDEVFDAGGPRLNLVFLDSSNAFTVCLLPRH